MDRTLAMIRADFLSAPPTLITAAERPTAMRAAPLGFNQSYS